MSFFNPGPLMRARHNLGVAQRNLVDAQRACALAKVALEDAGRQTEATALEMICASMNQSERDIIKWREMTQKTRENGNGG